MSLDPTPLEAALAAALRAALEELDDANDDPDGYDEAPVPLPNDRRYTVLADVLDRALDQAAAGKGNERHASGKAFEDQPMQTISHLLGTPDGMAFQAIKKLREGLHLPTTDRQVAEMLGAIVYIAGIIVYLEGRRL